MLSTSVHGPDAVSPDQSLYLATSAEVIRDQVTSTLVFPTRAVRSTGAGGADASTRRLLVTNPA
jgi:hypothetical protein